jgi:hypothetical protein
VPGDERSRRLSDDAVIARLAGGELELLGLLPRASNHTFLARVAGVDGGTLAVYKPRAGETPLWDFPEGTLYRREVAAYEVARELGWPTVPPTIVRDGPAGIGAVQLFVDFDPARHYFTLIDDRRDDLRRVALFDLIVNNADRKGGHCLVSTQGEVFVIDHGICFHAAPKLRTVIWDFAGEPVPDADRRDAARVAASLTGGALRDRLLELLTREEVEATERRAGAVATIETFPAPGPGHAYPWPPL